jgi:hypothetical protein
LLPLELLLVQPQELELLGPEPRLLALQTEVAVRKLQVQVFQQSCSG